MSMSETDLDALQGFIDAEFNDGVPQVETADVEPATVPGSPVTPELTIDAQGRAHGPDGKFISAAAEESSIEEEIPTAVEIDASAESGETPNDTPDVDVVDDDVLELDPDTLGVDADHVLFTKYDGDLPKALAALQESQRLVGERAQEVGDLRRDNEQLRALTEQLSSLEARLTPYRNDVDENPEGLVMEVVQRAAQTGLFDDSTYDAALQVWADESPFEAARIDARVQMAKSMAAQQAATESGPPGATDGNDDLVREVEAFKQRHPDIQEMLPAINELAGQRPLLQAALYEGSARERALALEDLYELAKSRTVQSATSTASKKVILRAAQEADQAKNDASVVGASRSSAVQTEEPLTGDRLLEAALRDTLGLDDLKVV